MYLVTTIGQLGAPELERKAAGNGAFTLAVAAVALTVGGLSVWALLRCGKGKR